MKHELASYDSLQYRLAARLSHVRNPWLWPYFAGRIANRVRGKPSADPAERSRAASWCEERALGMESALKSLGVPPKPPLEELFPRVFAAAENRVASYPIPFTELRLAGPAGVDLLYSISVHLRARRVLETGVALGWSSLAFLLSLEGAEGCRLYSVDLPYLHLRGGGWVGLAVPRELTPNWTLYRMADRQGLPRAIRRGKQFDLCHYDSDKSVEGRLWAYAKMWESLREGGMLISDDVGDNSGWEQFCARVRRESLIILLEDKFVGVLVK